MSMSFPYQGRRRIAIVTTSWPASEEDPSGHFVRAEARALRDDGAEVVIFTPKTTSPIQDQRSFAANAGLDVVPLPGLDAFGFPGVVAKLRARPWQALGIVRFLDAARAALRHGGPYDRVIAHWAVPSAWPLVTELDRLELAAELEVVSHGGDVRLLVGLPPPMRAHVVGRILERLGPRGAWRFVSNALADELARALEPALARALAARTQIRPAGYELPDPAALRAHADALRAQHGAFVTTIGRLVPTKRVDAVVRTAWAEKKRLVVVGDGPERPALERLARELGAGDRVRFTGLLPRREALAWLAASTELWFASVAEGSSTVLREASALGTPVRRLP
jgi:glycosyltransferase involved in cell wall biosynthesis